MDDQATFYITTPIFYPNGQPHMGHAYTATFADILTRYYRMRGFSTYFLTGTDENSEKVGQAAEKAGKDVAVFTDDVVANFKEFYSDLDISYNQFIRTTDRERHWPGATEVWKRLVKKGDIYKGIYEGLYCVGCESFKTEKELDDKGNCPDHGTKPEKIKEENYFFKLSKYTSEIKKRIEKEELHILPETRRKEVLSFLEEGLEDISFSRPKKVVPWGIPVPDDPEQVMYVWCDALTNYISALGFGTKEDDRFKQFWPADVHIVGKDILRFHTMIWPGMLLSAGIPLPKAVFVHGMIISEGKKMSKTLGNVLHPQDFIDEYGAEALRYYLSREINPVEDSDMTPERFKKMYNGGLANGLGNVVSRIMKMVEQYAVEVDELSFESRESILSSEDAAEYREAFESFRIDKAADSIWGEIAFMDSYIQETKPFKTIEEDEEKAHQDIMFLVQRLWEIAVLLEPFMPETAEVIEEAIESGKAPKNLFPRKK